LTERPRILEHVDRAAIERNDLLAATRAHRPAAVDAHLRRVAGEVDAPRRRPGSLLHAVDASAGR
jgi:hypothetical protein